MTEENNGFDMNEYQEQARKFAFYPGRGEKVDVVALKKMVVDMSSMTPSSLKGSILLHDIIAALDRLPAAEVHVGLMYVALGLAGEAGEFSDKVKKVLRDNYGAVHEDRRQELIKELGDALWYLAACADELHVSLADVARSNIHKLSSRERAGTLGGSGDNR